MMKQIDDFLNNITMYRLVLYFLILLAGVGLIYSIAGVLPFDPINYVFSFTFLLVVSGIANLVFAKVFEAQANVESWIISALILGLIIAPPKTFSDVIFIGWAAVLMVTSKFVLAIGKKHIFNPVALSVAVTALVIGGTANWWVGNVAFLPIVVIGGFLIVRKIKRWDLVLSFLIAALILIGPTRWVRSVNDTPLIFFAMIMLTEPLTTPPTKTLRIIYGVLVGLLFAPQIHIGSFYTTPEIALIFGNIFSYIVSPKYKLVLTLRQKIKLTPDTYDFVFWPDRKINFAAGQYMEWTLEHESSDARGNRRYLSLASSPTEREVRIGVKVGFPPSTFKKKLIALVPGQKIVAGQLIGDFTMPFDKNKKLVLIAGGIGITPFRSIIKYLVDKNEKRDIVLIYTASNQSDFVYRDVFGQARDILGIKTIYIDSKTQGHIDAAKLSREIPDCKDRTFYISGSHGVVSAFENILKQLQIPRNQIVTDYFPGFA
ncbi:MAG TPA: RnfABCDGE type electron transport complex subunit D [Candidatus Saccharimonadales bacterium]|nr:RnfABCDGE type electron transport complex subunit D [Candidatus Saccharimonadales bacterium]